MSESDSVQAEQAVAVEEYEQSLRHSRAAFYYGIEIGPTMRAIYRDRLLRAPKRDDPLSEWTVKAFESTRSILSEAIDLVSLGIDLRDHDNLQETYAATLGNVWRPGILQSQFVCRAAQQGTSGILYLVCRPVYVTYRDETRTPAIDVATAERRRRA